MSRNTPPLTTTNITSPGELIATYIFYGTATQLTNKNNKKQQKTTTTTTLPSSQSDIENIKQPLFFKNSVSQKIIRPLQPIAGPVRHYLHPIAPMINITLLHFHFLIDYYLPISHHYHYLLRHTTPLLIWYRLLLPSHTFTTHCYTSQLLFEVLSLLVFPGWSNYDLILLPRMLLYKREETGLSSDDAR